MITFSFLLTNPDNFILRKSIDYYHMQYPDMLEVIGEFRIIINSDVFFLEPQFPVLEFIDFLAKWLMAKNKNSDMHYNSIETNDNPLISFIYSHGKWFIKSMWEKFTCHHSFSRNDLENAIRNLEDSVNAQLDDWVRTRECD